MALVVPTLDEEDAIRGLLPELAGIADQVIVSDGGSRDGTLSAARSAGAHVVTGPPGRGPQLNRGAAAASAAILVFLHADTRLPSGGVEKIRSSVAAGAVGGGFQVRFDHPAPIFSLGSGIVNLRTRLTRAPLGDQCQFATQQAFHQLGGFREWPILEDIDFARRLKRLGKVAIIGDPVTTSARRFERGGIFSTIANNWLIFGLYFSGVSPHRLAKLYRRGR